MEKLNLMVDMDEVLYRYMFPNMIAEYLQRELTEEDYEKVGYYLQDLIPDKEKFFDWFFTQNMYDYSEVAPHSQKVLRELMEYYNVFITTAYTFKERPKGVKRILTDKFERLLIDFPFLDFTNIVMINNKQIIDADIMIDDRLSNMKNARRKLLFLAYHTKYYPEELIKQERAELVDDWQEVGRLLLKK